tara:strand:+ start:1005 stop:1250 length:246 start_codon:yes stop_codon:yes gene_type:complete
VLALEWVPGLEQAWGRAQALEQEQELVQEWALGWEQVMRMTVMGCRRRRRSRLELASVLALEPERSGRKPSSRWPLTKSCC